MRAAVLTGPERLEIRDVETPAPGPGELLVRLKACGICTLEQRLFSGEMKMPYPLVPGHEAAGEVAAAGPQAPPGFAPGTRVALDLVMRCGTCHYCRTGRSNMCQNRFNANQRVLGGFGEYIVVRPSQAFPIPDALTFEEAAFAEPVACCIRSLKNVGLRLSEDLLVVGAGPMGQMHLQIALCMGARVFVSDPDAGRLERRLGRRRKLQLDFAFFRQSRPASTSGIGEAGGVLGHFFFAAMNERLVGRRKLEAADEGIPIQGDGEAGNIEGYLLRHGFR